MADAFEIYNGGIPDWWNGSGGWGGGGYWPGGGFGPLNPTNDPGYYGWPNDPWGIIPPPFIWDGPSGGGGTGVYSQTPTSSGTGTPANEGNNGGGGGTIGGGTSGLPNDINGVGNSTGINMGTAANPLGGLGGSSGSIPQTVNNVLSILGPLSNIYGAIQGNNNQDWLRGALATVLANEQNYGVLPGSQAFNQYSNMLQGVAGSNLQNPAALLYGPDNNGLTQNLLNSLQNQSGNLQNTLNQYSGGQGNLGYTNPLMEGAQQALTNSGNMLGNPLQAYAGALSNGGVQGLQNTANLAGQGFAGGGWTPQYQQGFDQLTNFFNGNPVTGAAQALAGTLLGQSGQTAYTNQSQKLANDVASSGGWIPQLNMSLPALQQILNNGGNTSQSNNLAQAGNLMLNNNGMTPTGQAAVNAGLAGVQSGGQTPLTQALSQFGLNQAQNPGTPFTNGTQQQGLNLINTKAVMTPQQAVSIARNQAGTDAMANAKAAYAQALRRGGGPGSMSGLQNEAMTDFADKVAQAQSQAATQALQGQQAALLQQQGQGTNMLNVGGGLQNQAQQTGVNAALGGGGLAQSLLGTYGGILGNAQNTAANLYGTAAGMLGQSGSLANSLLSNGLSNVPQLTNAAANYVSPYIQLGLGAANNVTGNINAGNSLASMLQQGQLGGINSLSGLMGNQNQYALGLGGLQNNINQGLGGLLNSTAGTQGNIYNNLYNTGTAGGQLGLNQYSALTGAQNQNYGNQLTLGNLYNSLMNTGNNPLTALAGQGADILRTGLSAQSGIFGNQGNTTTSPWTTALNTGH